MKKICILFSLLILSILSFAQVNLQTLVKPGTKLIYAVEAGEQKYNFIVTVKTLVPALVFDWEMTNDNKSSGTITHTATAMIAGNTMYNYFSPGTKALDDNTLSVWLSKNIFTGLTKGTRNVISLWLTLFQFIVDILKFLITEFVFKFIFQVQIEIRCRAGGRVGDFFQ